MDAAVAVFTLGAFAVWASAFCWARRRPEYPWYHVWVLVLTTLFWFIGESLAIRLGKYDYAAFPPVLRFNFPFLGPDPNHLGWVENHLLSLIPSGEGPPWRFDPMCKAVSYGIPLPVVAIEAALLFGFFRLAAAFLRVNLVGASFLGIDRGRWRTATATGGLCALLMVNLFAVMDPVVSTHSWCQPPNHDPVAATYLPVGLWNWFTTSTHPGYWFGVPLINYAGWFIGASVFGLLARLDDERDDGLVRKYKWWILYPIATIVILALYLLFAMVALVVVDRILIHGQQYIFGHDVVEPRTWQLALLALILGLAFLAYWRGKHQSRIKIEVVAAAPKVLALLYCFWLLWQYFQGAIFALWCIAATITTIVLWPLITSNTRRAFGIPQSLPAPAAPETSPDSEVV
jgi:carotenoid biosynthesis protein